MSFLIATLEAESETKLLVIYDSIQWYSLVGVSSVA